MSQMVLPEWVSHAEPSISLAEVPTSQIDIDAYDEDVLLEGELCEPDTRDPTQVLSDAKPCIMTTYQFSSRITKTIQDAIIHGLKELYTFKFR
ncbi:hypothetical protein C8R48DRAFT_778510 [Suillus tomentosus]|nr:hypothetical protein C8R48DRAFT_778510 [Suillus tomentosus]